MAEENVKAFILKSIAMVGDAQFDVEAFGKSESFQGILENHACKDANPDEGSEGAIAFWKARGLTKEMHHADTGRLYDKWASYLPNEIIEGKAEGKKYPLLFVLHGAGNPIYLAETYGYTNIAAREKLIVIIPEDESPESIESLYAYALAHYPVDLSRVYMVGYSLGGLMTSRHAFRWPDKLAGVGVGGMLFANGHAIPQTQGGKTWPAEEITPEKVENAAHYGVPCCISIGENEALELVPVTKNSPIDYWLKPMTEEEIRRLDVEAASGPSRWKHLDLTGRNKVASLNNWRRINGCRAISEEEIQEAVNGTADIVVEKTGFPFEKTCVVTRENRSYFIGDSVRADGSTSLRLIVCAKMPHCISQAQAELTWEFISQFAKDPKTGKSYRLE